MKTAPSPESNDLAIASLVLGVISLAGLGLLAGIPAVITGYLALRQPGARGMSIAGIIMGGISILLALVIGFVLLLFVVLGSMAASTYSEPAPQNDASEFDANYYERRI